MPEGEKTLFGPSRAHLISIFEHIFSDCAMLIIVLIAGIVTGNPTLILDNALLFAVVLFAPVLRLMGYFCSTLEITESEIIYRTGLVNKSVTQIPLSTITTVDITENLINQFSGTSRISIDNAGNMTEDSTRVEMTFGRAMARELKDMIGERSAMPVAAPEEGAAAEGAFRYSCSMGTLFIMGVMKEKFAFILKALAGIWIIIQFLSPVLDDMSQGSGPIADLMNMEVDLGSGAEMYYKLIGAACLAALITGVIGGGLYNMLKYSGFKVRDTGSALIIEYGFFVKKSYTIPKEKITGLQFRQSLLLRSIKVGVLHCIAVGYGTGGNEETQETPLVVPWLKEGDLETVAEKILPDFRDLGIEQRPAPGARFYFLLTPMPVFGTICLVICAVVRSIPPVNDLPVDILPLGVICFLLGIASAMMSFRNTRISVGSEAVVVRAGGFNTKKTMVRRSKMEAVEDSGSLRKRAKGIVSVDVYFWAPAGDGIVTARNVPVAAFQQTRDSLIT